MEDFEGCLHLGGESLDGFAHLRGGKAVDVHEPGDREVQISVIAGDGGGCRGRRAATVDHWAAVVNGTRAAGGGGGGIVLPAARGAGGAVEPVEAAGAEKVTEAAGRIVVRAGGTCWELVLKVEVVRR